MVVKLRSTRPTDPACPHCGGSRIKNGTRIVRFLDIPTAGGQAVVIDWLRQKLVCSLCHRSSLMTSTQEPRSTTRYDSSLRRVGREGGRRTRFHRRGKAGFRQSEDRASYLSGNRKKLGGMAVDRLSDAIAIEPIDLAGSKRPAILDARGEFVFEVYATVQEMQARLPAFAKEYLCQHEHPIVATNLSLVLGAEGSPPPVGPDLFGTQAVRVISRISLEREVISRIWHACEPFLRQKYPEGEPWRFVRALLSRRESSMKTIAQSHLKAWKETDRELYAAYELKEDFLNIWQPEAVPLVEGRLDAWMQRDRAPSCPAPRCAYRHDFHASVEQMLAFSRYDFLVGFLSERLTEITSLDKNRTAGSFSAARAALLARGL